MRIALIGQAAFGEAVFTALREAGEDVVAVSSITGTAERLTRCTPPRRRRLPFFPPASSRSPMCSSLRRHPADLASCVRDAHPAGARAGAAAARHDPVHPSLLPRHRGINSMHWALRHGDLATGLTIFWSMRASIPARSSSSASPDRDRGHRRLALFRQALPAGRAGDGGRGAHGARGHGAEDRAGRVAATYEPPADDANSGIDWNAPALGVYNLVRAPTRRPARTPASMTSACACTPRA